MIHSIFDAAPIDIPTLKKSWLFGAEPSGVSVTRSGVATFVNSAGLIEAASDDTQRIDYSNGSAGLLIEESRTNLFTYSSQFDNADWLKLGTVTINPNQAIAPDGTLSAYQITTSGTSGSNLIRQTFASPLSNMDYTITVYFKAVTPGLNNIFRINLRATGGTTKEIFKNYAATGEWQRATLTMNVGNNTTLDARPLREIIGIADIYLWGAQLEVASKESSFIPTSATSVTRNADDVTISDFTDFWRAGKGAALVKARPSTVSGVRPVLQFDDGTADNIIALRGNAANPELYVRTGGVDQAQIDAGTIAADTSYRLAGAWSTNNCAASFNSGTPVLDGVATIPTVTQARLGSDGTNYINGHIEAIEYYDERLPSASLQVVSSSVGYQSIIGPVFRDSIIA